MLGTLRCARGEEEGPCPTPNTLATTHLSWECSLVAFELKSSQMG